MVKTWMGRERVVGLENRSHPAEEVSEIHSLLGGEWSVRTVEAGTGSTHFRPRPSRIDHVFSLLSCPRKGHSSAGRCGLSSTWRTADRGSDRLSKPHHPRVRARPSRPLDPISPTTDRYPTVTTATTVLDDNRARTLHGRLWIL